MRGWPGRSEDEVPSPRLVAAWLVLDELSTEHLPLWAAHWIARGYDGPDVVALASLSGRDPHDVRDVLDAALANCEVKRPSTIAAAATVAFTDLAAMQAAGRVSERAVLDKVVEVVSTNGHPADVVTLPLGRIWGLDDEWDTGWGRPREELRAVIRAACSEQLSFAGG